MVFRLPMCPIACLCPCTMQSQLHPPRMWTMSQHGGFSSACSSLWRLHSLTFGTARTRIQSRPTVPQIADLTTSSGIVDVLALRSFVILYLAFESTRYTDAVGGGRSWALPVDTALAQELSFAWMLAHNLVDHITHTFAFVTVARPVNSTVRLPSSFSEAADVSTPDAVYYFSHCLSR